MTSELELTIERPSFGGAGLARHEGRIVFVEGGLPGSRVAARITKHGKNCLKAQALAVLSPSPEATDPFCPHFGPCGGCSWQDARYQAQLAWKREIVQEQLKRLGGLEAPVAPCVPSPLTRGYRNKMEFAFAPGEPFRLGLRERHQPSRVVEVTACRLMPDAAMDIVAAVRRLGAATQLPPYFARTGAGVWRHLVLRHSEASGRWLAQLIVGPAAPAKRLRPLGEALLAQCPQLDGVLLDIRQDRADFAIGERRAWLIGQEHLEETLDGLVFQVSARSFFQTNTKAAAALYAQAVSAAHLDGSQHVWDLYCGAGGLSLFLARQARSVAGFEISAQAVADAAHNAARNGLSNCSFVTNDLKAAVARRKDTPGVAVLDPPRAGLHPDSLPILARLGAHRLVYVSCNASTMARDLGRLEQTHILEGVTPVDLFPHTPHIECVAALKAR